MPHARVDSLNLYYEIDGSGPAVVLLSGLGADGHFWYQQVPALAERFAVITVDNRDAGRSDKPEGAYTLRDLADDVAGLLDALGIPSVHMVAASMGGFIAQEFALTHPRRLRRLVLCCTSFGGPRSEPIPPQTLQVLMSRTGDPERDLRAFLALQFGTDYPERHRRDIDAYVKWRVNHPQPLPSYRRQLAASIQHNAEERLRTLPHPVLILHGGRDQVVPVRNAELLAATLPNSRRRIFEDGGHLFLWEYAEQANRMIIEFLETMMVSNRVAPTSVPLDFIGGAQRPSGSEAGGI